MAATLPKSTGGTYTFASQPRAVAPQRSGKFREPSTAAPAETALTYGNMMYDPRIVRGNTFRLQATSSVKTTDPLELQMQQEKQRRTLAKKRAEEKLRVHTPDAVSGRQHTEVQTELYLEELTDRVEETEVETQTDAFLDRPPSPMFVPVKSGVDVWTQIANGELFDFDVEVRPILEVLIGKTVEQALMEVMEEDELSRLRAHQRDFEELRSIELIETQRREEAARRAREEKDRRVRQARDALVKEKETSEKVEARAFAKTYVASLVPAVFASLSTSGYFYDQQEREIESQFLPWLLEKVEEKLFQQNKARQVLDAILESVVRRRADAYAALDPKPAAPPAAVRPASAPSAPPAAAAIPEENTAVPEPAPAGDDAAPAAADPAPASDQPTPAADTTAVPADGDAAAAVSAEDSPAAPVESTSETVPEPAAPEPSSDAAAEPAAVPEGAGQPADIPEGVVSESAAVDAPVVDTAVVPEPSAEPVPVEDASEHSAAPTDTPAAAGGEAEGGAAPEGDGQS